MWIVIVIFINSSVEMHGFFATKQECLIYEYSMLSKDSISTCQKGLANKIGEVK